MERTEIEQILTGNPEQWYRADLFDGQVVHFKGSQPSTSTLCDGQDWGVAPHHIILSLRPVDGPPVEGECEWTERADAHAWFPRCRDGGILLDVDNSSIVLGWAHCPYCGKRLKVAAAKEPAPVPAIEERLAKLEERMAAVEEPGIAVLGHRPKH